MVSCTHGEVYGRPLAEATCCDLPVIASNWSAQLDFLSDKDSLLISGFLKEVPKSALWPPIVVEPSKWFNVQESDVIRKFRLFYKKEKLIAFYDSGHFDYFSYYLCTRIKYFEFPASL